MDTRTFFVPIEDDNVPRKLMSRVINWRKMASNMGYEGPVVWRVCQGFTLKWHAPLAGPCLNNFDHLQDWSLEKDETTQSALVFFIPRVVTETLGRVESDQARILAGVRIKYSLPKHHLTSFGSAGLLAGLLLAHVRHFSDKSSLDRFAARTDTIRGQDQKFLGLHFDEDSLNCCDGESVCDRSVGVFPLAAEPC